MDQEAFRALLSTPRDTPSTSTRAFGVRHKRVAETSAPAEKSTSFKPRPQAPKKGKSKKDKPEGEGSASASSQYVDRAALRRQGLDHDYSHVDQLKAELEARNGEDGLDDEQMQYLGGDAEHSVLVKGLDHSLLAQNKAKQAAQDEQQAEEELNTLLDSSAPAPVVSKKRSRQERIEQLKGKLNKVEPVQEEEDAFRSKFRKVGDVKIAPVEKKIDGKGKKLRKKKKVPEPSTVHAVATEVPVEAQIPQAVAEARAPEPEMPKVEPEEPPEEEVDPDMDIFAGAAEYGATSSSDEEEGSIRPPPEPIASTSKANWFDDDVEIHADPISAPSLPKRAPVPVVEVDDGRLKGYEGGIDVKGILEADRAAEKEEKRKERKAKYAKPVEGEPKEEKKKKKLTDADKLNRDHQELEAYWKRKEPGAKEKQQGDQE